MFSLCWWALRLTYNWTRGWPGIQHEDWRYTSIRGTFPDGFFGSFAYWIVGSFLSIHLFPTLMVWFANAPLYAVFITGTEKVNVVDYIAFAISMGAPTLQLVADEQMRAFTV